MYEKFTSKIFYRRKYPDLRYITPIHALSGCHRYLTEHLPPPSTIPLNITLSVPQKNFTAIDVLLRPEENMAAILKKLRSLMEKEGLEIVEFPPCNEFVISIIR